MNDGFALSPTELQKSKTLAELQECNRFTAPYGLFLSDKQIGVLTERRIAALKDTGRIEFGEGILKKLVIEFCDSPYITQENYEDTMVELQDSFYYYKNESMDLISDDDLIFFMKRHFDGICQGSLDYLNSTSLDDLCRNTRYGYEADDTDRYGHHF